MIVFDNRYFFSVITKMSRWDPDLDLVGSVIKCPPRTEFGSLIQDHETAGPGPNAYYDTEHSFKVFCVAGVVTWCESTNSCSICL
jgi:hypothetical protein